MAVLTITKLLYNNSWLLMIWANFGVVAKIDAPKNPMAPRLSTILPYLQPASPEVHWLLRRYRLSTVINTRRILRL